jgi:hypothetical protein
VNTTDTQLLNVLCESGHLMIKQHQWFTSMNDILLTFVLNQPNPDIFRSKITYQFKEITFFRYLEYKCIQNIVDSGKPLVLLTAVDSDSTHL